MLDLFVEFNLSLHSSKVFVVVGILVEKLEGGIFRGNSVRFNRSTDLFRHDPRFVQREISDPALV